MLQLRICHSDFGDSDRAIWSLPRPAPRDTQGIRRQGSRLLPLGRRGVPGGPRAPGGLAVTRPSQKPILSATTPRPPPPPRWAQLPQNDRGDHRRQPRWPLPGVLAEATPDSQPGRPQAGTAGAGSGRGRGHRRRGTPARLPQPRPPGPPARAPPRPAPRRRPPNPSAAHVTSAACDDLIPGVG
jgi:hypothetical protein